MWTEGMDFNYQNAQTWFKNLDKLIPYTNQRVCDVQTLLLSHDINFVSYRLITLDFRAKILLLFNLF